jgi:hypothetical protein
MSFFMKHLIIFTITIFLAVACRAQNIEKTNPIIYFDAAIDVPLAGANGLGLSTSLNYQFKNNLVTARIEAFQALASGTVAYSPFTVFPTFKNSGELAEYSLLDGWRTVTRGHSFSISAGISYNDQVFVYQPTGADTQMESYYVGIPFEMDFLWVKIHRKNYYSDSSTPVPARIKFGYSFGFKLSGNVSEHSYIALGIVFVGLGWDRRN